MFAASLLGFKSVGDEVLLVADQGEDGYLSDRPTSRGSIFSREILQFLKEIVVISGEIIL